MWIPFQLVAGCDDPSMFTEGKLNGAVSQVHKLEEASPTFSF